MRMGQGVRTGLGHEGISCVLQTQFFSLFLLTIVYKDIVVLSLRLLTMLFFFKYTY